MNNPLDHDFEEFKLSEKDRNYRDNTVDLLQTFDAQVEPNDSIITLPIRLLNCEICGKQFITKKQLRVHIFTHLGKARVVLKRVSNLKTVKKKSGDTYWLDPEKRGSLKLTLKKQNYTDSLKLTLKKSSKSEDFAVVNNNFNLDIVDRCIEEVAGVKEDDQRDANVSEKSITQTFENVMVEQQDGYENIKFGSEGHNSLEDNEKPSLDVNEGDSGVGSDMANPSEKEDQNVDDLQVADHYDNSEKRLSEIEDHEESDALEATCRETIENLKKLEEQSSSRSTNQLIDNSCVEDDDDVDEEDDDDDNNNNEDDDDNDDDDDGKNEVDMIHNLDENPAIGIISKSSTFPNHSTRCSPVSESEQKSHETPDETSEFNWNQLSTNLTNKSNQNSKEVDQQPEHSDDSIENPGSLLQNFLIEHQRRNQNETSLSSNLPPVETEYVSLEKLAETVNTCRVCNEKFKDITHLDEHRSKAGHYQCNIPECINLIFHSPLEVTMHKSQMHGTPLSPNVSQLSPHLNANSPHLNQQSSPHLNQASPHLNQASPHLNQASPHLNQASPHLNQVSPHLNQGSPHLNQASSHLNQASPHLNQASPHLSQASPHLNQASPHLNQASPHLNQVSPHLNQASSQLTHSPHAVSMESSNPQNPVQLNRNSPLTSPHQTNSPTFNTVPNAGQQIIPPVNFEQLPAPVQQLAQQVQRMPLPQTQLPPSLPPGANTMIPGPSYFVQPPGRPPLYRVPGPQSMHYSPHITHLYSQYGTGPYPQMTAPPQMHPQVSQQIPRGRYPSVVQNTRAPRVPQTGMVPRQRMKRPLQQSMQMQQQNSNTLKQRRMDVLLPDRNEDADCHVIAQQKRNDGLPVIQNVQGATTQQTNRNDSTIHLTDSITLSVRQPGSAPAQLQNTSNPGGKKSDAKAVANVLAARGITVTPAANKNKASEQNKQQLPVVMQPQRTTSSQQPLNVTALNLNSAISIIPATSQRKQDQGQFAVPQNKQNKSSMNEVERPPRPPTVDLTQDGPPQVPVVRRGRPPRALLTCQVCDKTYQNQEMLTQHMATHRATSKLVHKCNLCPAQYPTAAALATHKQTYHKEVDTMTQNGGAELALPVVDLKSPHVLNRLSSLGIQSYIPLSQLSVQTGGYFGLPIITIDGARSPNICNLGALGATSILSLGPLKHISNRLKLTKILSIRYFFAMNAGTLNSRAEKYFYSINSLAQRIGEDIAATKEAYEGLWNTLSVIERNQAINETIIQPEVALQYTLKNIEPTKELPEWYPKLRIQTGMKYVIDETGSTLRWRDEHSAPFSFMTQSQMNLNLIEPGEEYKSRCLRSHFGESPHFSSPIKIQKCNSNSINDNYNSSNQVGRYQSECYSNNIFENEQHDNLLKNSTANEQQESLFVKLINKTSLLKLQNSLEDEMLESLVRDRDSDTDRSQSHTLVASSLTKSSDINEATALLETPSSYSSFQSSQLNQEDEERCIPKTGFEFLDNW